jgi:hypothetical protein
MDAKRLRRLEFDLKRSGIHFARTALPQAPDPKSIQAKARSVARRHALRHAPIQDSVGNGDAIPIDRQSEKDGSGCRHGGGAVDHGANGKVTSHSESR